MHQVEGLETDHTSIVIKSVVFKIYQKAQFVKLKATNLGDVPSWHLGHPFDGKAWIFTDEIEIK